MTPSTRVRLLATLAMITTAVASMPGARLHAAQARRFDVVSIHPAPNDAASRRPVFVGGRYTAVAVTVRSLIGAAYGTLDRPLPEIRLTGAPDWTASERFDVTATVSAADEGAPQDAALPALLQSLLADRFGLRAHFETREQRTYDLTFANSDRGLGPQIRPHSGACGEEAASRPAGERCGGQIAPGVVSARGVSFERIASGLERQFPGIARTVVDRTGLPGLFDLDLRYTPDQLPPGAATDADAPSLISALNEQLGLKLVPSRASVQVLVIDAVSRPSAN